VRQEHLKSVLVFSQALLTHRISIHEDQIFKVVESYNSLATTSDIWFKKTLIIWQSCDHSWSCCCAPAVWSLDNQQYINQCYTWAIQEALPELAVLYESVYHHSLIMSHNTVAFLKPTLICQSAILSGMSYRNTNTTLYSCFSATIITKHTWPMNPQSLTL